MDRLRAGEAVDADANIREWIESDFAGPLAEWLGMTEAEYASFAEARMYGPDTVKD